VGKAHHKGKDLTEIRSQQRKLAPDIAGLDKGEPTSLRGIAKRAKACKTTRFGNLYRELNAEMLHHCWRDLNKKAASGVDRITAQDYEVDLESNIENLVERLKSKRYRTKLVRRHYIPKANGKLRPLGIPALEDKLVQLGCAKLLNAIYEQDFLRNSYGYRPGKSAKDAVMDLGFNLQYGKMGWVVEADIKGFFDHLDHDWLLKMLSLRINDRALLNLIRKWLKAGILDTDGQVLLPDSGTPQGGIISPILANVYLHYVLDLWFKKVVKKHCTGEAMIVRYADDFVCAFRYQEDAERFYKVLPKRLEKFGLEVAQEKTRLLRFSRYQPELPNGFAFLGFEIYWGKDWTGVLRVRRRTERKKLQGAKGRMKEWIRGNRHLQGKAFIVSLNRKLVGHYNYYGLKGNLDSLHSFYAWTIKTAYKWLNRRGGKRSSFNWSSFRLALKKLGVAMPRITEKRRRHVVFA
jgi:group II intron reverse transcriptase/maturase